MWRLMWAPQDGARVAKRLNGTLAITTSGAPDECGEALNVVVTSPGALHHPG